MGLMLARATASSLTEGSTYLLVNITYIIGLIGNG
jgi:hypothetical protein